MQILTFFCGKTNKRTIKFLFRTIFLKRNLPPPSIVLIENQENMFKVKLLGPGLNGTSQINLSI